MACANLPNSVSLFLVNSLTIVTFSQILKNLSIQNFCFTRCHFHLLDNHANRTFMKLLTKTFHSFELGVQNLSRKKQFLLLFPHV